MSKGNLFAAAPVKSKNLVEFKAGKMTIDDNNWVYADKRKGLVYVYQSEGLTHFCWKDRISGAIEDDFLIFPEDAVFKKVEECSTGRVYMLKFQDSKKLFYWIQEPKTDKDEELCKKTNDALNSVHQAGSDTKGGISSKRDVQELLANAADLNFSQSDLMSILGMDSSAMRDAGNESEGTRTIRIPVGSRSRPAVTSALPPKPASRPKDTPSTTNETSAPTESEKDGSGNQKFKINDLRSIFKTIQDTNVPNRVHVDLTDAVNSETVFPLLSNQEYVKRLESFLPADSINGSSTEPVKLIKDNIQCPQMHGAIKTLGNAIQTGEFSSALSQFNLGENVTLAAQSGDLKAVCKSMEAYLCKPKPQPEGPSSMATNDSLQQPVSKQSIDNAAGTTKSSDIATNEESVQQGDEPMEHD